MRKFLILFFGVYFSIQFPLTAEAFEKNEYLPRISLNTDMIGNESFIGSYVNVGLASSLGDDDSDGYVSLQYGKGLRGEKVLLSRYYWGGAGFLLGAADIGISMMKNEYDTKKIALEVGGMVWFGRINLVASKDSFSVEIGIGQ